MNRLEPTDQRVAIQVEGLQKSYGSRRVLRGIDLVIRHGEIFALLGPNGAGKTTTVEILAGFLQRDGGRVLVLDVDPSRPSRAWRSCIGVVFQDSRLDPELSVKECFQLFAAYYPSPLAVDKAMAMVGLERSARTRAGRLSGGQRRRLDVGLALVGDPEVLFLDEPTTGFDPAARRQFWQVVRELRSLGKTVLLTTHYTEEAEVLADRVAILVGGRIAAQGSPKELGDALGLNSHVRFALPSPDDRQELTRLLAALDRQGGRPLESLSWDGDEAEVLTRRPVKSLDMIIAWALARGVTLTRLELRRPDLEEVYLHLVAAEPKTRESAS